MWTIVIHPCRIYLRILIYYSDSDIHNTYIYSRTNACSVPGYHGFCSNGFCVHNGLFIVAYVSLVSHIRTIFV